MQNQDPTADTDPNEYINQLVQVNSLEQLININQNLQSALGQPSSSAAANNATASSAAAKAASPSLSTSPAAQTRVQAAAEKALEQLNAMTSANGSTLGARQAPGNLSVPEARPAAHRVAQALSGQAHAR